MPWVKLAMLNGYLLYYVMVCLLVMLDFILVLVTITLVTFRTALKIAERDGSLIQ
jgi:hypothetical protein